MNVSAIIPSRNRRLQVARLALGLSEAGCETIVVDDCSTPSVDIPGVKVVRNPVRMGSAYSRNLGAGYASRDWLLFLDDDMMLPEDFFLHLDRVVSKADVVGFAITGANYTGRGRVRLGSSLPRRLVNISLGVDIPTESGFCRFVPAAMLVRRELFVKVGGYDHRSYIGNCFREESDLQARLRGAGARIYYSAHPCVVHSPSGAGGHEKAAALSGYDYSRNNTIFVMRHYGLPGVHMVAVFSLYLLTKRAGLRPLVTGVAAAA